MIMVHRLAVVWCFVVSLIDLRSASHTSSLSQGGPCPATSLSAAVTNMNAAPRCHVCFPVQCCLWKVCEGKGAKEEMGP